VLRVGIDGVQGSSPERRGRAPPPADGQREQPHPDPEEESLREEDRVLGPLALAAPERGEEEWVAGWPESLPLGEIELRFGEPAAGVVEEADRMEVVGARLQPSRVPAVEDRLAGRRVRPAVGLDVVFDERDVEKAVERSYEREQQSEPHEARLRQGAHATVER